jgi:hypothetical protein
LQKKEKFQREPAEMDEIQRKEPNRIELQNDARKVALDQKAEETVDLDRNTGDCRIFTV